MEQIYDMIVIGGGPAGYTAALYAARSGLSTLVLEKLSAGGQMALTEQIDNYPGFESGIDGFTLGEKMQQSAERFGAVTERAEVYKASLSGEIKTLDTSEGVFQSRTVAIATGASPRPLGVPDEEALIGKGVHFCAACDGAPYRGRTVAVVGSGPAGLSCAQRLNRRGHSVTVFERADRPGGLLMYGIPNMKLEKSVVQRRLDLMAAEGIAFRTGVDAGRDVGQEELREQFDAVVLCCGAAQPRDLDVPGRAGVDVWFAVDFLTGATRALLDGTYCPSAQGKDVVIVGGGDTGNDCVGTCIRQGCKSVTQLEIMRKAPGARTAKNPWPEWPRVCKTDYGQEEAIAIFGHDPRIYETTVSHLLRDAEGHLTGVETVLLGPDRKPLTGTEKLLPCQLLLIAVGFLGPQDYVPEAFGLTRTPCSTVQTAEGGYSTNIPGVFTAGDMRRGQSLVVWAIREGREAAWEVDRYLMGHGEWTELPLIQTD